MALLGERVLPDAVNSRRRQLRARLADLRDPVRQFREDTVPGDFNLVGMVESTAGDLRDRFVNRTTVLERIQSRRQGGGTSGNAGNGTASGNNSTSNGGASEAQEQLQ